MIRVEIIEVHTRHAASTSSADESYKKEERKKLEKVISRIGYENIKNIIVSAPNSVFSYYSIFYEDGLPDTPYAKEEPPKKDKKKGIFG